MPAPRDTDTGGPRRRAKARRRRTTPVSRARAQQRQYVSQGKAVRRAATQQRATPRNVAPVTSTHPKARHTPATRARAQQRTYVSQGRSVSKVAREQRALAKRRGHRARQRYFKGKPVEAFQRKIDRGGRALGLLRMSDPEGYDARNRKADRNLPKLLLTGGPNVIFKPKQANRIGTSLFNVGAATWENPKQVGGTSLRTARESITGIPQGVKAIIDDPVGAVDAMVKDYEDRYGSALDNPRKFRERVKSEWGLTPYVFDAAAAAGGLGQVAGGVAKTSRFGRAAAALERAGADPVTRAVGRAGGAVHRTVATERPALRFSAGEKGVRRQARSRNLFVAAGQSRLDRSRAKALTKRTEGSQRRALDLEVKAGEVTPVTKGIVGRSLREYGRTNRRYTGRIARDVGSGTSQTRLRLLGARIDVLAKRAQPILRSLDKHEKVAVREMAELGVRSGPQGIRALKRRLAKLESDGFGDSVDAVAIRKVLSDPERHLTPKLDKAATELTNIQIERAALDPELPEATELMSRIAAQAEHLGLRRGPNVNEFLKTVRKIEEKTGVVGLAELARDVAHALPEERPALTKALVGEMENALGGATRRSSTAEKAVLQTESQIKGTGRITTPEVRAARRELAVAVRDRDRLSGELKGRRGEHVKVRGVRSGGDFRIVATREGLAAAKEKVKVARQAVREAEGNAPVGTPAQRVRLRKVQHEAAARAETVKRVAKIEKAVRQVHRKAKSQARQQANRSTFNPRLLEGHREFAERVRKAADAAGLEEPAYWKGILEGDLKPAPRLAAAGKGVRATERTRRKEMKLTRRGGGERDPEVLIRGLETNLKRQFQYELVRKNILTHAFGWSHNGGKGMTIDAIKRYALKHDIDLNSISIIDSRIITREPNGPDAPDVPRDLADDVSTSAIGEMRDATPGSWGGFRSRTLQDVVDNPRKYGHLAQNRYLTMPSEVGEAIDGVANALDSPFMRGVEFMLKRVPSTLLLGLSPPWLMFQAASNAIFTGLAGTNPLDLVGGVKFSQRLKAADPEAHAAWEAENGITRGHHLITDTSNPGATNNHFVAYMRAMKATRLGQLIHRKNPFDILFKGDNAQNNFWRQAVWYSKARRESYRRMNYNYKASYKLIDRLSAGVLTKGPERLVQQYSKHGPEFEAAAKHVSDFLGDYVNYTPSERLFLSRHLMFYGWLRHSLRFTFYTMPIGHPIMTDILSNIGRMGAQEQKALLGVPRSYNLPMSIGAGVYWRDKDKQLRSFSAGRLNPFLNAISQLDENQQALGMVSPMVQMAADQLFEVSTFTGRPWNIKGQPTPMRKPRSYYGSTLSLLNPLDYAIPGLTEGKPRNRILQRQFLNLGFPYRAWEKAKLEPSQSEDALAWSPRPMQYKNEETKQSLAKDRRRWRQEGPGAAIRNEVFPFPLPGLDAKRSGAREFLKSEMEKEADVANKARGKRKSRRRSTNRGGAGAGSRGGSSTGSRGG